jgi:hypothetical protein
MRLEHSEKGSIMHHTGPGSIVQLDECDGYPLTVCGEPERHRRGQHNG